jgi:hypothetical protein
MVDAGILRENDGVELIRTEILELSHRVSSVQLTRGHRFD